MIGHVGAPYRKVLGGVAGPLGRYLVGRARCPLGLALGQGVPGPTAGTHDVVVDIQRFRERRVAQVVGLALKYPRLVTALVGGLDLARQRRPIARAGPPAIEIHRIRRALAIGRRPLIRSREHDALLGRIEQIVAFDPDVREEALDLPALGDRPVGAPLGVDAGQCVLARYQGSVSGRLEDMRLHALLGPQVVADRRDAFISAKVDHGVEMPAVVSRQGFAGEALHALVAAVNRHAVAHAVLELGLRYQP